MAGAPEGQSSLERVSRGCSLLVLHREAKELVQSHTASSFQSWDSVSNPKGQHPASREPLPGPAGPREHVEKPVCPGLAPAELTLGSARATCCLATIPSPPPSGKFWAPATGSRAVGQRRPGRVWPGYQISWSPPSPLSFQNRTFSQRPSLSSAVPVPLTSPPAAPSLPADLGGARATGQGKGLRAETEQRLRLLGPLQLPQGLCQCA